jgi:hypothetical protein
MKNIEFTESGLQCDNPKCDWKDETITFDNLKDWINKPCPLCGENVLTEEDYKNAEIIESSVNYINSLSQDDLKKLSAAIGVSSIYALKDTPLFKDAKGIDEVKDEGFVEMSVSSHKQIKVEEIKNVDKT